MILFYSMLPLELFTSIKEPGTPWNIKRSTTAAKMEIAYLNISNHRRK